MLLSVLVIDCGGVCEGDVTVDDDVDEEGVECVVLLGLVRLEAELFAAVSSPKCGVWCVVCVHTNAYPNNQL